MNKALVTGANGFIGQALCRRFLQQGLSFTAAVRRELSPALESVALPYHKISDIDGNTDWTDVLSGIDVIVHLAGRAHVMHERHADPLHAYRIVNTAGTLNLARQAAAAGVKRFVFMSSVKACEGGLSSDTATVYASSQPTSPPDAYALSKWEAELGLKHIASSCGMDVVILRPPLVYGPGVGANFLQLLRAVDCGYPLPLGSVANMRSLIYVGNLVDAISTCITHPAAANQTFLLSDGEDVSTPELIRRVADALNRPARLIAVSPHIIRLAGVLLGKRQAVDRLLGSLCVDSRAIRQELNWSAPFSMEQGLQETAAWYRSQPW